MTTADDPSVTPWKDFDPTWLAGDELGGKFGAAVEITIPPGRSYPVYSHRKAERVVYVYAGQGVHKGSGGPIQISADDVLVLPAGSWHGLGNTGEEPLKAWVIWSPQTSFPTDDYEVAGPDQDDFDGQVTHRKLREAPEDPDTTPSSAGFENLGIIWGGAEGAEAITLGWAHFEADGVHRMHRHPHGDEILHPLKGTGWHVTPAGERAMTGPAYEFAPAGEWHEMQVREGRLEGIFVYLGGATLEEAGYELMEAAGH